MLADAVGGDEMLSQLVLARIIEPASKLDSLRLLEEAGIKDYVTSLATCPTEPLSLPSS